MRRAEEGCLVGFDKVATLATHQMGVVKVIGVMIKEGWLKVVKKEDANSMKRQFVEVGTPKIAMNLQGIIASASSASSRHR